MKLSVSLIQAHASSPPAVSLSAFRPDSTSSFGSPTCPRRAWRCSACAQQLAFFDKNAAHSLDSGSPGAGESNDWGPRILYGQDTHRACESVILKSYSLVEGRVTPPGQRHVSASLRNSTQESELLRSMWSDPFFSTTLRGSIWRRTANVWL